MIDFKSTYKSGLLFLTPADVDDLLLSDFMGIQLIKNRFIFRFFIVYSYISPVNLLFHLVYGIRI